MHPELSFQEYETSKFIKSILKKWRIPFQENIANTGIVVLLKGKNSEKKCVGLRADFDALPIKEENDVDYCSKNDGVMHACGHDVHATIVLGAMQILAAMQAECELPWPVSVRAILQPAEELAVGARHMIHHHALRGVDTILALHVDPTRLVGCVGLRSGILTAACDAIHVRVQGKGGHGARPHMTNDPIDAVTHWVQSAFRRIGRTADPHETVVFSVGQIEGGHGANVIPDTASLAGSLRSVDQE